MTPLYSKLVATCGTAAAVLALAAGPVRAESEDRYPEYEDHYRTQAAAYQTEDAGGFATEQASSEQRGFSGLVSDAWITTKVRSRLIRHPGVAPFAIDVDTNDGVVTMFGSVGAEVDRREAGRQAMMVSGVKDVRNELQVVSLDAAKQIEKSDGKIRDSVEQRLGARDGLGNDDIEVGVANGVVRLTGSVDQSGDRMAALSLARTTQGVRSVIDDLQVKLESRADVQTEPERRRDQS
jgi:hyperosmotically inducible protein